MTLAQRSRSLKVFEMLSPHGRTDGHLTGVTSHSRERWIISINQLFSYTGTQPYAPTHACMHIHIEHAKRRNQSLRIWQLVGSLIHALQLRITTLFPSVATTRRDCVDCDVERSEIALRRADSLSTPPPPPPPLRRRSRRSINRHRVLICVRQTADVVSGLRRRSMLSCSTFRGRARVPLDPTKTNRPPRSPSGAQMSTRMTKHWFELKEIYNSHQHQRKPNVFSNKNAHGTISGPISNIGLYSCILITANLPNCLSWPRDCISDFMFICFCFFFVISFSFWSRADGAVD